MNGERILSVALAACCLFALGTAAATLESSVDTRPDDVIDFEAGSLPLPSDDVSSLKRQIQSSSAGDQSGGQPADPAPGSQTEPQDTSRDDSSEKQRRLQPGDGAQRGGAADDSGEPEPVPSGQGNQPGQAPGEPSLLDRLLELLGELLDLLVSLLPVVALVGAVAMGIRYRDRLHSRLARLRDRLGLGTTRSRSDDAEPHPSPSNEVTAAWFEMVRRVGLDEETTRTPRQCEQAAIEAGANDDVVRSLTTTFEEVAYGGAPVTDQRRSRTRRDIQRIRSQLRGGQRG